MTETWVPPGSEPVITPVAPGENPFEVAQRPPRVTYGSIDEIPEAQGVGSFMGDMLYGLARTMLFDEDAVHILKKMNPGSEIFEHEGAYGIEFPDGTREFVNKPGASKTDALQGAGLMATGGLGGLAGKQILKWFAPQLIKKMATKAGTATGAGAIGTSDAILRDAAGNQIVGEGEINFNRALVEGLGSAVGQKMFNFLLPRMARRGNELINWFRSDGELSKDAIAALTEAGIDHTVLTPQQIKLVNQSVRRFSHFQPAEQGRAAFQEAQGIRPTMGSITQNPADQLPESMAGKGAYGADDAFVVETNVTRPRGERVSELADDLAPEADVGVTQAALSNKYRTGIKAFDDAFDDARARGARTLAGPNIHQAVRDHALAQVQKDFSKFDAGEVLNDFPEIEKGQVGQTVQELLAWRQRVAKRGAAGQAAAHAADEVLEEAARLQLLRGDPDVVPDWLALLQDYKQFKKTWNAGDLVERLISTDKQNQALLVSPEEAANFLLNSSDLGWTTKRGLPGAIGKMRNILGADNPAFLELRNEIAQRVIGKGYIKHDVDNQLTRFSGKSMRKAFETAMERRRDTMRMLFTPEELAQMDNFTKLVSWLSPSPAKGGQLNSTTPIGDFHSLITKTLDRNAAPGSRSVVPLINSMLGGFEAGARRMDASSRLAHALNPLIYGPQTPLGLLGPAFSRANGFSAMAQSYPGIRDFFTEMLRPEENNSQGQ